MTKGISIAAIVALLVTAGSVGWTAHRLSVMTRKGEELAATLQSAATNVSDYTEFQLAEFKSDAYQRRIKQGFEVGRDASITIAKFNREFIPRLNKMTDEGTATLAYLREHNLVSLDTATLQVATLISNTDDSINQTLIPRIAALADAFKIDIEKVAELINSLNLTAQELTNLAKNPDIPTIIKSFNAMAAHLDGVTKSFDEGMTKFPDLMASFQKYARASTTWQKRLYLAMIIRQLAAIPLRLP